MRGLISAAVTRLRNLFESGAGAGLIGFIHEGISAVKRSVKDRLKEKISVKDFGAVGDGIADDTAAIQAAITAAGDFGTVVFPRATYNQNGSVAPRKGQTFIGNGSTINVAPGIVAYTSDEDLWPGRIKFDNLRFVSSGKTGKAIYFHNNTPMIFIDRCYFEGFDVAVHLIGSYCSVISRSHFTLNKYGTIGVAFINSTIRECMYDWNTEANIGLNGTSGGPLHSNQYLTPGITIERTALQGAKYGLWAEFVFDLKLSELYCESNSIHDLHIGDFVSGGVNRYCYGVSLDGAYLNSTMGSAGHPNLYISNTTRSKFKNLTFSDSQSTAAALVKVTSGSASVEIDITEHPNGTIGATWPVDATEAASGTIVSLEGTQYRPRNNRAFKFGAPGDAGMEIYRRTTPSVGRPALSIESVGASHDLMFRVQDVVRFYDSADASKLEISHVGSAVSSAYPVQPLTDNVVSIGAAGKRWTQLHAATATINTSDEREKRQISLIDSAVLRAWGKVEYCQFKFNDAVALKGDGARWHFGVIAQRVKEAFESEGLDPFAYGILCFDRWEDKFEDVLGEDGDPTGERIQTQWAGERYGIRYEEALVLECAYLRSR